MTKILLCFCFFLEVILWIHGIPPHPHTSTTPRPSPPTWDKIDSRPLPSWFDKAKIGIFIHWGIYSVPSFYSEWFWNDWKGNPSPNENAHKLIQEYMDKNYKPGFSYQDFASDFTAEFFNATQWADIIENSGAKYVILTSKHHDGYALWPSNYSFGWNSMDVGPHRDIVGELSKAVREKKDIHFGLYHSLYEWFHPLYLLDKHFGFRTKNFVNSKIFPELQELVTLYEPEIIWSDGEWEADSSYWRSVEFLNWLYTISPVSVRDNVVVNDRWGHDTLCKHGGYYTCKDRYNPGTLQNHKWENAMTIDTTTWGFNRKSNIGNYISIENLIKTIAETVACGGNLVMNVGPSKDGTIAPIFQERLSQVGQWLKLNGEAIYESEPWDVCQNDTVTPNIWYTAKNQGKVVYAIMLEWPKTGVIYLACIEAGNKTEIAFVNAPDIKLQFTTTPKHMVKIGLPDKAVATSNWGWVLRMTNTVVP